MTAPADRWVRATDWARIAALAGLPPSAVPADVIAALDRRRAAKDAARVDGEARVIVIRGCSRCDPSGWCLGPDGAPVEPAVRCDHGAAAAQPPSDVRDITEPIHRSDQ